MKQGPLPGNCEATKPALGLLRPSAQDNSGLNSKSVFLQFLTVTWVCRYH